MTKETAEQAITTSALVVAGVYLFRKLSENANGTHPMKADTVAAQLFGIGEVPSVGTFVTGWGFAFLVISIIGAASPGLGGSLAILVATSDVLANGTSIAVDVNQKLNPATVKGSATQQGFAVTGTDTITHNSDGTPIVPTTTKHPVTITSTDLFRGFTP